MGMVNDEKRGEKKLKGRKDRGRRRDETKKLWRGEAGEGSGGKEVGEKEGVKRGERYEIPPTSRRGYELLPTSRRGRRKMILLQKQSLEIHIVIPIALINPLLHKII